MIETVGQLKTDLNNVVGFFKDSNKEMETLLTGLGNANRPSAKKALWKAIQEMSAGNRTKIHGVILPLVKQQYGDKGQWGLVIRNATLPKKEIERKSGSFFEILDDEKMLEKYAGACLTVLWDEDPIDEMKLQPNFWNGFKKGIEDLGKKLKETKNQKIRAACVFAASYNHANVVDLYFERVLLTSKDKDNVSASKGNVSAAEIIDLNRFA